MRIVVGSHNEKKAAEMRTILADLGVEVVSLPDGAPDVVEDGVTFEDNARKKAVELAVHLGETVLADDSGLVVEALDGRPGVHSARFSGEHGNDAKNVEKLFEMMRGVEDRRAAFRCVIALAEPDGPVFTVEGQCSGSISLEPRGTNGFGYDPVFVPEGSESTFAEMPAGEKNAISHRGKALQAFREKLSELLGRS